MTSATQTRPPSRGLLARSLCLFGALFVGPWIGATLAMLAFIAMPGIFDAPAPPDELLGFWLVSLLGALIVGGPIALGALVLMLPFWRRPSLSLPLVLTATFVSTLVCGLWASSHRSFGDTLFSGGMAAFLLLSTASAALYWRLTKRWHSPA
ncbi:MAG: hypothetical protein JWL93_78 [Hyphomicrobiales bacterium]|nr:hypothetical protein [Hyphomicrobiales bacterium]